MAQECAFDRRPLALVALISGGVLAWRALSFATLSDPIAAWPWLGGDTADYAASGLMLRGVPLGMGMRPPLIPALVALGDAGGWLGLVPLFGLAVACATPVLLAPGIAARAGGWAASVAALALLVAQSWLRHGLEWMADVPGAAMFALGVAALAPAHGPPRWLRAGVLGSLSLLTSQIGILLVPLALGAWALARPRGAEAYRAAIGSALPLACAGVWFVAKTLFSPHPGVEHWRLLGLRVEGLAPFLWQVLAAWGWPGSLAALAGLVVLARRARARPLELIPIAAVLAMVVWWGILYSFRAPRFAAVLLPLLTLPTALGLALVPGSLLRLAATVLVVLAAAWPLPGFTPTGATVPAVLWPSLVVRVPITWEANASMTHRPARARLSWQTPRVDDLAWVAAGAQVSPPMTVGAGALDGVAGVLLVDTSLEPRYGRMRQLAALVRAPAVGAPPVVMETLAVGRPRPLGTRGGFDLTRVESPLDGRDWILATPTGAAPLRLGGGGRDLTELERARAIAARRAGRHLVAVVEPGTSWWAWLWLLVPGDWLHYVQPRELPEFERLVGKTLGRGPVERLHGLTIEPVESLGRVGVVVRSAPTR